MGSDSSLTVPRVAAMYLMCIRGILIGGWMAFVPVFKQIFQLDDGELGLAILCAGSATLVMTVPVGRTIDVAGPRVVAMSTGIISPLMYAALPWVASRGWAPYVPVFVSSMIRAGGGIAFTSRASELERLYDRPLMSSFHAAFSAGCFIGSSGYAALLGFGIPGNTAFPILCIAVAVAAAMGVAVMDCGMPPRDKFMRKPIGPGAMVAPCSWTPSPLILCLGLLGALTQLVQGGIGDWGALYLHKYDHMPLAVAPLGYSLYAGTMGVCRLFGDAACHKWGRVAVYRGGGILMFIGLFCLIFFFNSPKLALVSCAIIGIGAANGYPILMSTAGRHGIPTPGLAIATVSSLGVTGLLAGPGIIGFLAQAFTLRVAMCSLLLAGVAVPLASPLVADDTDGLPMLTSPRDSDLDRYLLERLDSPCASCDSPVLQ
eukprot:Protomagalhaensia_sp_Gyna_25__775@NODE_1371_length_1900_cov_44_023106_g1102_i0_p1_GENE_NODE_1371_length_1900_cov_44_023106_g1102_i0NODE_1371_length_1900_cov_44_023106_g1102_i0_p1_ORF_typecomplete_len430_score41_93MFS_1/PF07690_16/1_6e05MFS_1/PF07690_16/1_2e03MFS_1/PF07690_16/2_2e09MFS_2/PF13347_6/1_1MFS_2/PF13347_6/7_1e08_NODE_1371_length_1900_cov_44_023106_g1102_i0411330